MVAEIAVIKSRGVPEGLRHRNLDGGTRNLVETVPRLVTRGLSVSIFTSDVGLSEPIVERLPGIEIHRLPGDEGENLAGVVLDLKRSAMFEADLLAYAPYAQRRFEVLHTHHWTSALPGLVARRASRIHVHTPHLLVTEKARMVGQTPDPRALQIERYGLENADRVIAVSEAEAASIAADYGVSAKKVSIIPNGVSEDFYEARLDPASIMRRLAWRPLRLVSVGRLVPQKGFDVLLRAMAVVRDTGVDVECDIVGAAYHSEPHYPNSLAALADELNLSSRVHFIGQRDSRGVAECLRKAAVCVQPSRYESQGVAILEAMAVGLPVVTTRLAAVTEFVRHGENGIVVNPNDPQAIAHALLYLVGNPAWAAEMSHANQLATETSRWDSSTDLLLDCIGCGLTVGA